MSASVGPIDGSVSRSLGGSQRASYFRKPACALGVLMTGYVEKMDPNAYIPKKRNRFLVATHQGLHWFKREKGVDLFGEERGSTTLSDITEADLHPGDDTAFYISFDDGGKRVFFAPTSEEASKWVHCIRTAIRSRFLYRRETLSGLSFIHALEGGEAEGIVRPRLLLLTHATWKGGDGEEGGRKGGKEVVVSRHVEYEKGLSMPPLRGEDDVRLFLVNGASVTMKGEEILAAVKRGEKGEGKMRLPVRGGSGAGMAGAVLVLRASLMAVSSIEEGGKEGEEVGGESPSAAAAAAAATAVSSASSSLSWWSPQIVLPLLLEVEQAIPLLCVVFLLLVLLAEDTSPLSSHELLRDRKTCAMLSVAMGLLLRVLNTVFNPRQDEGTATAATATAATATAATAKVTAAKKGKACGAISGVCLEVEDYIPPHSMLGKEGGGLERLLSSPSAVATPGNGGGAAAARGGGERGDGEGPPIPQRFIDGCLGDMVEANRRWNLTYEWRREFGTDEILDEPQPFFDLIKECYPSWYCGQGKSGDPVYWERSGQVDQPRMKVAGCGIEELLRHYVMVTEFCWVKLYPDETKKTITVFDVGGVGIRDLAGDAFDFLRRSIHLISEHYPERSLVIMIVNAPSWFAVLWKMIRPMVNERTQKKVKIVSKKETLECLKEFIEEADIPIEYGGKLRFGEGKDTARFKSPQEVALREHVLAVNKRHRVEMVVDAKTKARDLAVLRGVDG